MTLADLFRITKSIEFFEGYETPEEKRKALKKLISDGLSSYFLVLGLTFFVCLSIALLRI